MSINFSEPTNTPKKPQQTPQQTPSPDPLQTSGKPSLTLTLMHYWVSALARLMKWWMPHSKL